MNFKIISEINSEMNLSMYDLSGKKVLYIDDEAEKGWADTFAMILFNINHLKPAKHDYNKITVISMRIMNHIHIL